MEKYDIKNIITGAGDDYDTVNIIKKSEKSIVSVVRSKKNGKRFILRKFSGKGEVYKKLMNVSCKNLPEIFSVYEEPDMTAVLEEYVSGDTLFSLLKCDVLSEKEAGDIVVQLCNALDSIHGIGAVHRDIKPENIIIDGNRAVLIDFDASRIVDPDKSTDTKILGTTGYAPPEQYGLSQTDSRSDIYALGVVLNVMLTGEHPSTKLAEGGLGKIVQKCTMIAPESRFQSTGELKSAVEDVIKPHKKAKSERSVLVAAAAAVLGIILSTAFLADKPGVIETGFCGAEENGKLNGYEVIPYEEDDFSDYIEISDLGAAKGKSLVLPPDFYNYWSAEEIITENIKLSMPGNLENYVNYKFSDDVLTFTVGNIPEEEWKKALSEVPEGESMVIASIILESPSENVCKIATHNGNGPTYSNLKMQEQSGVEIKYDDFNALMDYDWTGQVMD